VHGYSRVARVDLRPNVRARLRLDRRDGRPLLDFAIETGPDAFRIDGAPLTPRPAARYVHAIGDSYTMGWGVEARDSWPAQLGRRLRPGRDVLNLGVDGFGAIGATAKSRSLADRYPPEHAVYLFSPNDLEDDRRAAALQARSAARHSAHEALDAVRRWSYLAGIPFAIRYRAQFGSPGEATAASAAERESVAAAAAGSFGALLVPEPESLPAPRADEPSFAALLAYREFLASRGARLTVLVLSTKPESLAALRFCREQGIAVRLFDVPRELLIPDEGHFGAAGNAAVAALVESLLARGPLETGS
jgi:lysophospholipase L1-like esterase